jgi:antirestriction protein
MTEVPTPERPEAVANPEQKEAINEDEPRIYVASLSDYNAGRLHGAWINANQDTEDIEEDIKKMLTRSKEPIAEEWAIHDYEGFGPLYLSEYESIDHISRLSLGIVEHGIAFAHWANFLGSSQWDYLERFNEAFQGQWSTTVEFAESLLDDLGIDIDSMVDDRLLPYVNFDLDAFARDLSYDFHIVEDDNGGVYVFDNT